MVASGGGGGPGGKLTVVAMLIDEEGVLDACLTRLAAMEPSAFHRSTLRTKCWELMSLGWISRPVVKSLITRRTHGGGVIGRRSCLTCLLDHRYRPYSLNPFFVLDCPDEDAITGLEYKQICHSRKEHLYTYFVAKTAHASTLWLLNHIQREDKATTLTIVGR